MEPIIELYKTREYAESVEEAELTRMDAETPTLFSYINELSPVTPSASATAITPEQDVYSSLLLLKYLIGAKKYSIVSLSFSLTTPRTRSTLRETGIMR